MATNHTDAAGAEMTPPADPEHGLPATYGTGLAGRALFWLAVAFAAFQSSPPSACRWTSHSCRARGA